MSAKTVLTVFQALRELGSKPLLLNGLYRLGLRSGHYRRATPPPKPTAASQAETGEMQPILDLPDAGELLDVLGAAGRELLLQEAQEIVSGKVRLFGSELVALELIPPGLLQHWTAYEGWGGLPDGDIKFIWEPARFGWAFTLGRAYHITNDERFSQAFWSYFETFQQHNPPYLGQNWLSGQEVALRLMALAFCGQVFAASTHATPQRLHALAQAIAQHAQRIPPTLIYARSQNNNHLLSEAAGLYTAALALPQHPGAAHWRDLGWRWFNRGIQAQIDENGVYMQHSVNYHRLMLQLGLWVQALARKQGHALPDLTMERLGIASRWLQALLDPVSGCVPNLGANDGAYILPFSSLLFQDYRPVAQAAAAAFLRRLPLPAGAWDEMRLWLAPDGKRDGKDDAQPLQDGVPPSLVLNTLRKPGGIACLARSQPAIERTLGVIRHPADGAQSWAYLRLARFHDRPGHADLLHLDLWRRGVNLALDPGTYLYNAARPWDNTLTHTGVHNTVLVDGQEQMSRAGRFLYLNWAQTQTIPLEHPPVGALTGLAAQHKGYRRLGVTHQRQVSALQDGGWLVQDMLLPAEGAQRATGGLKAFDRRQAAADALQPPDASAPRRARQHHLVLHWLLPDCPWQVQQQGIERQDPAHGVDWKGQPLDIEGQAQLQCIEWQISLEVPDNPLVLSLRAEAPGVPLQPDLQIARAGELLHGSGEAHPTWGWYSPTYGVKIPALSLRLSVDSSLPLVFTSRWIFND